MVRRPATHLRARGTGAGGAVQGALRAATTLLARMMARLGAPRTRPPHTGGADVLQGSSGDAMPGAPSLAWPGWRACSARLTERPRRVLYASPALAQGKTAPCECHRLRRACGRTLRRVHHRRA
eukprot:scaffold993_cov393-Prasinococcus_capsulatus_cf.AAC.11